MIRTSVVAVSLLLAACSGGVGTSISKSVSHSWGASVGGTSHEAVVDDLDVLADHCKSQAERRLSPGGGRFDWRAKQQRKGDSMQFSGTVRVADHVMQVDCQADYGQPLRRVAVHMQPVE